MTPYFITNNKHMIKSVLSGEDELVLPLDYVWPKLANGIVEAIQQRKHKGGVTGPSAIEINGLGGEKHISSSWKPPVPLVKTPSDKDLSAFENIEKSDVRTQRLEKERLEDEGQEVEFEDDDRTALSFYLQLMHPVVAGRTVIRTEVLICTVDNRHISIDFTSPVHWWDEDNLGGFNLADESKDPEFPIREQDHEKLYSPEFNSRFGLSLTQSLLIRLGSSWRLVTVPVNRTRLATLPAQDIDGKLFSDIFKSGSHDVYVVHMDLGERFYVKTVSADGKESRRLHQDTLLDPAKGILFKPDRPNFIEIPINGFLWFLPSVKSLGDRLVVRWDRAGSTDSQTAIKDLNEARLTERLRQQRKAPRLLLTCELCEKPVSVSGGINNSKASSVLICSQVCSDKYWSLIGQRALKNKN